VKTKIGLIGVGHIGQYLVTGLAKANKDLVFLLADPSEKPAKAFASSMGCYFTPHNQEAVDRSEIIILATRPEHVLPALAGITFKSDQIVVSIAAGVSLDTLVPLVAPARAIRALPISCVFVNKSPVLMFPENQTVRDLFSLVGQVHLMPNEETFSPGTALVGAFYAWLFLLMDETVSWTAGQDIDAGLARKLVIQTIEGACAVARDQDEMGLGDIWKTLATPGGISQQGAKIIADRGGIKSWTEALAAINHRLKD